MKRALVLSLAIIFGLGVAAFGQTLSGTWTVDISIDATKVSFADALDFSSTLTVDYSVGGWVFGSSSTFIDTGWSDQIFTAVGALGAYLFDTTLDLGPDGTFDSWKVDAGVTMGGMTFGIVATLYGPAATNPGLSLVLTGSGSTNLVTITGALTFGDPTTTDCDLDWQGIKITAGFPFCCADVAATIEILCSGFSYAQFCVTGLTVANVPWLSLDACLKYELESKTLTLTPHVDFGEVACDFDFYVGLSSSGGVGPISGLSLGNIYIDGIKVACTIGDSVTFTGISYWGTSGTTTKPSALGDYWEMYQIATTDEGCCGPFAFDLSVFFDVNSTSLFDVAAFAANMSLEVATQLTFTMGLTYDVLSSIQTWDIGFVVTW